MGRRIRHSIWGHLRRLRDTSPLPEGICQIFGQGTTFAADIQYCSESYDCSLQWFDENLEKDEKPQEPPAVKQQTDFKVGERVNGIGGPESTPIVSGLKA